MNLDSALAGWHDFYLTTGAAAASLTGLLFVGLSLHIRVVAGHPEVRALARITLADFFVVLILAMVVLAPTSVANGLGYDLIGTGAAALVLIGRPFVTAIADRRARRLSIPLLGRRFVLSGVAFVAIVGLGVLIAGGDVGYALPGLEIATIALLVIAVRNTWDLLVTLAEK